MLSPTETILENLGERLIGDLRQAQIDRGLVASGKSAGSLRLEIVRAGQKVTLTIYGAFWWEYQETGIRAQKAGNSKRPSPKLIDIIRNWIKTKNLSIPLSAAGAIAYKIKNEGIQVPNAFNRGEVLSEPLNVDRVKNLLKPSLSSEFVSYIRSILTGDGSENG